MMGAPQTAGQGNATESFPCVGDNDRVDLHRRSYDWNGYEQHQNEVITEWDGQALAYREVDGAAG